MQRALGPTLGGILALFALSYVCYGAWAWSRAATVVDSGFSRAANVVGDEQAAAIYLDPDSYYWLSYAQRIGEGETFRVRYTFADNAPYGRPVHWSQTVSWILVIFGKIRQWTASKSLEQALAETAVWINPACLISFICATGWSLMKRVGPIPAGFFMLYFVTSGGVEWQFHPLRLGHQGLYCASSMIMLMALAFGGAGWIRVHGPASEARVSVAQPFDIPDVRTANRWFIISGASAAVGLWISAAVTTLVLAILFAAALVLAVSPDGTADNSGVRMKPELWRLWGWAAGAGSLLLYLIEYFPNHLALFRLEVNGPIYSVAAAVMGETVCQCLRARYGAREGRFASLLKAAACTMIVALLPVALFFGAREWHALRDPEMLRLHNCIQEFHSLPRFAGANAGKLFFETLGISPLFLVVAIGLGVFSDLRLQERAVISLSFALTIGLLAVGYLQVRWLGLYAAVNTWLALVTAVCGWRVVRERVTKQARQIIGSALLLTFLVQPVVFAVHKRTLLCDIFAQRRVPTDLINPVLKKRFALDFRALEGRGARVMADPTLAPALHYFAGGAAVASLYWENGDGLHAATEFFVDRKGDAARKIALERGVTHVAVQEGDQWQNYFYYIGSGRIDQDAAGQTFAARLAGSEFLLPPWLQTAAPLRQIGSRVYTYGGRPFGRMWRIYRVAGN